MTNSRERLSGLGLPGCEIERERERERERVRERVSESILTSSKTVVF